MDPLTGLVLAVVLAAVFFYVLYVVVRRAVAAGIRDAAGRAPATDAAGTPGPHAPD
ncbi:hypothetical protein [Microbacterium luticocti]|uniref:hypothetical protein n=1 Tax=Microbacterium luticocti TaxID=451764 RepID=UPI0003F5323D|nr:hypothetical protein [Microbacterium luticocti]